LQNRVEEYFGNLEIPAEPTIYDHLLIGLRKKDFIATFNWDPLLLQACKRVRPGAGIPTLLFLHGNVASGYCAKDNVNGFADRRCSKCGEKFSRTPLLYPIKKKDYASDRFISTGWDVFKGVLAHTFMVTIFGYSGPQSDQEALAAMGAAWGSTRNRELEQTCFITIQDESEITANFAQFIHTHHYEIDDDFYASWIAHHPRRTGEAWWNQYLEAKCLPDNPIPREASFEELGAWIKPFLEAENVFDSRERK
jgi:hypothetical protein